MKLGGVPAITEMLDRNLVDVTSLAHFHSLVKDVIQITNCHGRKFERLAGYNLKDIMNTR